MFVLIEIRPLLTILDLKLVRRRVIVLLEVILVDLPRQLTRRSVFVLIEIRPLLMIIHQRLTRRNVLVRIEILLVDLPRHITLLHTRRVPILQ